MNADDRCLVCSVHVGRALYCDRCSQAQCETCGGPGWTGPVGDETPCAECRGRGEVPRMPWHETTASDWD